VASPLERARQRARDALAAQLQAAWQRGRDGGEPGTDAALSAVGIVVNAWVTAAIAAGLAAMARDKAKAAADWDRAAGTRTCYCGTTATAVPGTFPHPDCDGSAAFDA
jgi:hypothetical protein